MTITEQTAPVAPAAAASVADKVRFSMRNLQLLQGGATMDSLGTVDNLWAHAKVYSSGGENALHAHAVEDHLFMVLQGEATFHFGDGSSFVARPFEGVLLGKGTQYRFTASDGENLVLLRVGGAQLKEPGGPLGKWGMPQELRGRRLGSDGQYLDGESKANGTHAQPVVVDTGKFFAAS